LSSSQSPDGTKCASQKAAQLANRIRVWSSSRAAAK
jgi:hypothetical protein